MVIFLITTMITSMGQFITAPLSPFLIADLALSKTQLGFLSSAVFWGTLACALAAGWLVDRIGERKMLLLGPGIIAAAVAAFSLSSQFALLLLASFFIGAGYSTINPLTNRGLASWFPPHQMAFAIGMKQSGMPLGNAIAAAVLPGLAVTYGWQTTAHTLAVAVAISAVILTLLYRPPATPPSRVIVPPPERNTPRQGILSLLLANKKLLLAGMMGMGFCMVQISLMTFLIPYLTDTLAFLPVTAGYFLSLAQIGGAVSRPVFGFISDTAFGGIRQYTLILLAVLAASLVILVSLASAAFPTWLLATVILLAGFTSMGWFGPFFALLTDLMGSQHVGLASGLGATINSISITISGPLFGFLVDTTGSYRLAFQVFAACLLTATLVFYLSPLGREAAAKRHSAQASTVACNQRSR